MKNTRLISLILHNCLFVWAGMCIATDSVAQSKVDSIISEVKTLNKYYNQRLTELYKEMYFAHYDSNLTVSERLRARSQYFLFPIEKNMGFLLDNIDKKGLNPDDLSEEYPYWKNLGKMIYQNEFLHPALMHKVMVRLDKPQTEERLFLFSFCFQEFFYLITNGSMDGNEKAACLRIMANSIRGVSQRKENLLKIADMLESR